MHHIHGWLVGVWSRTRVKIVKVSVPQGWKVGGQRLSIEKTPNQGGTCDDLSAPVLGVRDRIGDDVLQEDLGQGLGRAVPSRGLTRV